MEKLTNWLGKVVIFLLVAGGSSATGQLVQGGGGCTGACTMSSLALGGATPSGDALAVSGTTTLSGNATLTSSAFVRSYLHMQVGGTSASASLAAPADGVLTISNYNADNINRVQWGGTTSSFPAWKRSTTILQARLADDSAYSPIEGSTLRTACVAIGSLPAAGSAGRRSCVTDQITACAAVGIAPTAGGALVCPVFDNGVAWVGG